MVDQDDYEIVSQKDLDALRGEIAHIKKNPFGESNRGQSMIESMDRLETAITKLVRILEDAQTDIIAEYQESKPAEKISQILDQNETIARALLTINEGVKSTQEQLAQLNAKQKEAVSASPSTVSSTPSSFSAQNQDFIPLKPLSQSFTPQGTSTYGPSQSLMPPAQQSPFIPQGLSPMNMPQNPSFMPQGPSPMNMPPQSRQSPAQPSMNMQPLPSSLPPDLPPFNDLPPLNDFSSPVNPSSPLPQKKKILGFI